MSQEILHRKTGSAKRFASLTQKVEQKTDNGNFELSRSLPFLDGRVDILDIIAYRDTLDQGDQD